MHYEVSLWLKKFALHLTLKDSKESSSIESSILPWRIVNLLVRRLLPILYCEVFVNLFYFRILIIELLIKVQVHPVIAVFVAVVCFM